MKISNRLFLFSYALVHSAVIFVVSQYVPDPYMDEIYHIPQAERYARDGFLTGYYDPMITTPPGLYLAASPFLACLGLPPRYTNVIFSTALLAILQSSHSQLSALCCLTLPVLFSSSLLFYSDSLSILLTILLVMRQASKEAIGVSVAALLVRQTNALWICFAMGSQMMHRTEAITRYLLYETKALHLPNVYRKLSPTPYRIVLLPFYLLHLVCSAFTTPRFLLGYVIPLMAFAGYVVFYNEGHIVLGDKKSHVPVLHVAQLPYCFFFLALFYPMHALEGLFRAVSTRRGFAYILLLVGVFAVMLHPQCMQTHPYLLADNRHYTFYFHRKIAANAFTRYSIILLGAVLGSNWVFNTGFANHTRFWRLSWLAIVAATIVPQRLLEVRYFIPPIVTAMAMASSNKIETAASFYRNVLTLVWHFVIVVLSLILFLFQPIQYSKTETGRLMW